MPSPIFFLAVATLLSVLAYAGWQLKRVRKAQESDEQAGSNNA